MYNIDEIKLSDKTPDDIIKGFLKRLNENKIACPDAIELCLRNYMAENNLVFGEVK
jgi:K+-sensing histidine kinase KdpD